MGTRYGGGVCVILPTYNEAENLRPLVRELLGVFEQDEFSGTILVVDDASPDGTGAIADALAADDSRVEVLHRAGKEGLGRAYVAGFEAALARDPDLLIQMDADFSHDPASLPAFVRAAEEADVVLGSRYIPGGSVSEWGLGRRAISRGGCWYARTVLGVPIRDLTGGFKCFRREVLQAIDYKTVRAVGYAFQVETTYRALRQGYRVAEIPIQFTERREGASKMSWRIALEAAVLVPRLRVSGPRVSVPAVGTPRSDPTAAALDWDPGRRS